MLYLYTRMRYIHVQYVLLMFGHINFHIQIQVRVRDTCKSQHHTYPCACVAPSAPAASNITRENSSSHAVVTSKMLHYTLQTLALVSHLPVGLHIVL